MTSELITQKTGLQNHTSHQEVLTDHLNTRKHKNLRMLPIWQSRACLLFVERERIYFDKVKWEDLDRDERYVVVEIFFLYSF